MHTRIQICQLLEVRSHTTQYTYEEDTNSVASMGGREKTLAEKATDTATHAKHEVKEGVTAAVEKVRSVAK
jgi:hypothetical protein